MKKLCKKYGYVECYFNDSKLKKLYYMYLHQTMFDKALDVLVFLAVVTTVCEIVLQFVYSGEVWLHYLHMFSVVILVVFGLELFREYALSKTKRHFFAKHWLDFALVVFLSFYFVTVTYFGFARIRLFVNFGKYLAKIKQYKVIFRVFK